MEDNDKNKIKENITDQFIFHYYMHIKHANVFKRMKILYFRETMSPLTRQIRILQRVLIIR